MIPGQNSPQSAVDNGASVTLPVETNAAAQLPTYTAMAWVSIEKRAEKLPILAKLAKDVCKTVKG